MARSFNLDICFPQQLAKILGRRRHFRHEGFRQAGTRRYAFIGQPFAHGGLVDNGSAYTAAETIDFATALNLAPCFTPVRSPESNGVCEAFVKTLQRDYARVNPRPDAISVMQQLAAWFEDYNNIHPHSGLRIRSPREFMASQLSNQAMCPV